MRSTARDLQRLARRMERGAMLKLQRQDMAECAERWRAGGERPAYRDIDGKAHMLAIIRQSVSDLDAAPVPVRVDHAKRQLFRTRSVAGCMAGFPRGQRRRKAKPGRSRR